MYTFYLTLCNTHPTAHTLQHTHNNTYFLTGTLQHILFNRHFATDTLQYTLPNRHFETHKFCMNICLRVLRLEFRGGVKIENRENLGQCSNGGGGAKKNRNVPISRGGVSIFQKCLN